jgi:uncharacterized protein
MNIFIDIGHPAHVHYFKNALNIFINKGHSVFISARDKDVTHSLLNLMGIKYTSRGKGAVGIIDRFFYLLKADFNSIRWAKKFSADIFLSFGSPYATHAAFFLKKPHIVFDDTENAKYGQMLYKPFSSFICSPTTFSKNFGRKHYKFNGYMEFCYLHPRYFTPDKSIFGLLNLSPYDKFVILRFVKWAAIHDIGHQGLFFKTKIDAVREFSKYAAVYISCEDDLPSELKKYRITIPPDKIHHALFYSTLLYGESATMSSECALLGTPAIYLDNYGRGYTTEQELKYGSVFNFTESLSDQEKSIAKGIEILRSPNTLSWRNRRDNILNDKIDVTAFIVWLIENYPHSKYCLLNSPDFQYRFKF